MNQVWESMKLFVKTSWEKYKALIVIGFGVILALGYHKIIIDWLISAANKTYRDADKKSDQLRLEENKLSTQADDMVAQADALKKQEAETKVGQNWDQQ